MSIDKFGRSSRGQKRPLRGPKGEGFNLTPEGDYDIQNKKIRNLAAPEKSTDATTKRYVDSKSVPYNKDTWTFRNKKISNIEDPEAEYDGVNLRTLNKLSLTLGENEQYDARNKRVCNAGVPQVNGDVVNLNYMNEKLQPISNTLAAQQISMNELKERMAKCEGRIEENKNYHDKNLKKFGVYVYNYINQKSTGRTVALPTVGEGDFLNWEELFKLPQPQPPKPPTGDTLYEIPVDEDVHHIIFPPNR